MKVALIGGTGAFGKALGKRLVEAGAEVIVGSRDAARAQDAAEELGAAAGMTNEDAVRAADLAVLAVKADAALDTARELADALGGTPLLSVAAELNFGPDGVKPAPEALSLAAANLGGEEQPEEDALVCGDDERAKELALELAGTVVRGRAVDAGPLASARALEGLTAVIVNVNRRYKAHAGIRVSGLR